MPRDKELYEALTDDAVRRAEEMCASLSTKLGLERRGQTTYFQGAISGVGDDERRFTKVTVAALDNDAHLTVIADHELPQTRKVLLVYRQAPGSDMKYLGVLRNQRTGNRQDDKPGEQQFARFEILQDVRKR
ncbi:hypothetical protein IC757_05330 [Wenzhouxiangella sp. AB-CW3]|uniref:hypothetical protein n=1 Tax=Wenzhouxiangella sp. AB-CW3 TaxID=2771012 RepID=UPI00168BB7A9|nr:hypothetical protein [Wenzhouxiangella sp. AB-CW3]QOC23562.1 hypothetical protein IC757_05330 [Wenzhouxiangella sp. AB-CW3]